MFKLTVDPELAPNKPERVTIGFEKGCPVSVNGEVLSPAKLIENWQQLGINLCEDGTHLHLLCLPEIMTQIIAELSQIQNCAILSYGW